MRDVRLPLLLAPVLLAACLDPTPIPESNYGVIGLNTVVGTSDTVLAPEAVFYRSGLLSLPTSRLTNDQCLAMDYPAPTQGGTLPRFLDAGDSVIVSTPTTTKSLWPVITASGESYVLESSDRFPFHPGENVTITVPGAAGGFSAGTITIATASPFTVGPVPATPPIGDPLPITWSPAGDDSTKILLSLRYGVNGEVEPNQQIFCSLVDDGSTEIPETLVPAWRTATTGSRRVNAARWRVSAKEVSGGVLVVVSAFEIEQGAEQ